MGWTKEEHSIFDRATNFIERNVTGVPLTSSQLTKLRNIRAGKMSDAPGIIEYNSHTLWLTVEYVWHERFEYMLNSMSFNGTSHKFNMFAKLLSENIALVWKKEQIAKEKQVRADAKIQATDLPNFENPYKVEERDRTKEEFAELWK